MKNKQGAVSYFEETYEISLPRRFFISEKTSASSSSLFLANFSRRPICHTYSFISVTLGKLRRRALLPVPARRWTLSTWLKASGELAEGDGAYESDHAWAPVSYDRAFLATRRTGQWGKMHCFIRPPFLSTTLYCIIVIMIVKIIFSRTLIYSCCWYFALHFEPSIIPDSFSDFDVTRMRIKVKLFLK